MVAQKKTPRSNDEFDDGIEKRALSEPKADTFKFVPGVIYFTICVILESECIDSRDSLWHWFSRNEFKGTSTSFARR